MINPSITLLTITLALAFFAWIGFRVRVQHISVEDYIVARNSQGVMTLGLSFLASGMGAWLLFAPPEVGALIGLTGVLGYALGAAAPIAAFALLGKRLRRVVPAGHSLTEFVRLRFGRVFHTYVIVVSILYMLIFVTAELTAIGGITALLSRLDGRVAIAAVASVTLAYTAYGGLRASLQTDRWQAWLLLVLLGIATFTVVQALPAPTSALAESGLLGIDRVGVEVAVTLIIAVTAANLFHQGYWQRVWAARNTAALVYGAGIGIGMTLPIVLLVGVLGILAAGAGVDIGSPPVPFFALLGGMPTWIGLAVLVLSVTLVASSIDTLENGLAALVTAERRNISLQGARLVTVILMVPAIVVAMQGYSVLQLFLIADLLCATAVVPALLSLWSRATSSAALAGAIAGLFGAVVPGWVSTGSIVSGIWLATFPDAVPTLPPFLGALLASTIVAIGVSLASRQITDLDQIGARVSVLPGEQ
jgi:SSS family solute:Na+ symporter